uniref:ShKT domain-containing protein n=1 Tax=Panagrolaimus sp. ES5 TaxID=591445 RepID=A0AC34FE54_9BILA
MICHELQMWDQNARQFITQQQQMDANTVINAPAVPQQPWLSPAVPQPFNPSPFACMDLGCVCSYMRGLGGPGGQCVLSNGQQLRPALRKEYRQMTDNERQRFHSVLQQLKRNGEYDRLSEQHRQVGTASGAHSGPGFLPWHREYLKRFEISIRMIDPGLAIPYWDSVLDFYLPDPRDSIIWSPMFFGETDFNGNVVNGPFGGWRTLEGNSFITRRLGFEGRLFNESDINNVMGQTEIQNILAYSAPQQGCPFPPNYGAIEYSHSSVHLWVGGDMKPPSTSGNDPVFFLHHSFVDYIWEQWRQMRQSRWTREQAYPQDYVWCANQQHFANANMRPFEITNRGGLSNAYTDAMYQYAPRPTCSHQNIGGCASAYLFCDTRFAFAHCVSKVKMGGNCFGLQGQDACFGGICMNGRCIPGQFGGGVQQQQQQLPAPAPVTQRPIQQPRFQPPPQQPAFSVTNNIRRAPQRLPAPQRPAAAAPRRTAATPQRSFLAAVTTPTANCYNDDPCCPLWAGRNECRQNTNYMSRYCKRSCGYCRSSTPDRQGCFDRHRSCAYYRSQGECTRRRQWMSENCRASCGWCNIPQSRLCASVARFSRM